ncbi:hypothetical protein VNO78_20789 [Psophocarpus tetragonolobus]|uniref:Uncharacterized protein n=1 Tax=Psophocarpus tetragonolobus TaxID=3891 RepID=A0AAN9S9W8_PSOTE
MYVFIEKVQEYKMHVEYMPIELMVVIPYQGWHQKQSIHRELLDKAIWSQKSRDPHTHIPHYPYFTCSFPFQHSHPKGSQGSGFISFLQILGSSA